MATSDARKHTIPEGADAPDVVAALAALSASIRDVTQVADQTARDALVAALTAAGLAPSPTNPLYIDRANATPGRNLQRFDGTTWETYVSSLGGGLASAGGSLAWGSVDPGAVRQTTITFPIAFTTAPAVTFNPGSTRLVGSVVNITATGCTLQSQNVTSVASAVATATWIAQEIG